MKVAVTGNMGAGKSTFARLLAEVAGDAAALVDADVESRRVVDESLPLRRSLAAAFGQDLLDADGCLDRRGVARRALADDTGRRRLEEIVRPHLQPRLEAALSRAEAAGAIAILDAPLVYEWGIQDWFERIVVVAADTERAARRVATGRGLSADEVRQRRAAQQAAPAADPRVLHVDNNGSLDDLRKLARATWNALTETT